MTEQVVEKCSLPVEFTVGLPFTKKQLMFSMVGKAGRPQAVLPPHCIHSEVSDDRVVQLCNRDANGSNGFLCKTHEAIVLGKRVERVRQPERSVTADIIETEKEAIKEHGFTKLGGTRLALRSWNGPNPPAIVRDYTSFEDEIAYFED